MDCLQIEGLKVAARIGVYPWEQQILQSLLIDITIPANFSACEDQLSNTIDYDKLCKYITQQIESQCFQLIETAANYLALAIKTEFKIKQLTLSVSKPYAIKNAKNIRVTISR